MCPQVQLLVIDSVTFHFRHDFDDYMLRTRLLNNMAQTLMSLAEEYQLAVRNIVLVSLCLADTNTEYYIYIYIYKVVLMNQVTTKIGDRAIDGSGVLIPALGESWGHNCTNRYVPLHSFLSIQNFLHGFSSEGHKRNTTDCWFGFALKKKNINISNNKQKGDIVLEGRPALCPLAKIAFHGDQDSAVHDNHRWDQGCSSLCCFWV